MYTRVTIVVGQDTWPANDSSCLTVMSYQCKNHDCKKAFLFTIFQPAIPSITGNGDGQYNSRAYFFDNPRRYDSDDDLARHAQQGSV